MGFFLFPINSTTHYCQNVYWKCVNDVIMPGLLTRLEVKMAAYNWPVSLFFHVDGPRESQGP